MKLKLMDEVFHPTLNLTGQTTRIRHNIATIQFVTDQKVKKNLKMLSNRNFHAWTIDGRTT